MEYTNLHDVKYIYWSREADRVLLNHDEFDEKSLYYQKRGYNVPGKRKSVRKEWHFNHSYRFDDEGTQPTLYVCDFVKGKPVYTIYYTYLDEEKANRKGDNKGAGSHGFNYLNSLFRENNKLSMEAAFGKLPNDTELYNCTCAIKSARYLDPKYKNIRLKNLYKADISSAWPSVITKDIPDMNTARTEKGTIKPSEEWPVAFYIKSGHIAEFGKYDTHDWLYDRWYSQIVKQAIENDNKCDHFKNIALEDDMTILCKYSKYDLESEINEMYSIKENKTDITRSEDMKTMLNASIGFMRSVKYNKQHFMPHISTLAYTRATLKMMELANGLVEEGSLPIYFAIDSIIWLGGPSKLTSKKSLGSFVSEAEGARGYLAATGQYCIEKDGELLFDKHQGIKGVKYDAKNIKNLDDFVKEMSGPIKVQNGYSSTKHLFIEQEIISI